MRIKAHKMRRFRCQKCLVVAKQWTTTPCFLEQGDTGECGFLQLLYSENFYLYPKTKKKS